MAHEWTVIENVDDDFLTRLNDIQSYCSSLKSSNRDGIYIYLSQTLVVFNFVNNITKS